MAMVEEATLYSRHRNTPIIKGVQLMPVCYKINIISALKEKGYTTYKIRNDKIFSENTLQAFRSGKMVSFDTIGKLCEMLNCQPGDLLAYVSDKESC